MRPALLILPFALLAATTMNQAVAFEWHDGDIVTYDQGTWGDPTSAAGMLLDGNFITVFGGGVFEVGIHGTAGFSNQFTTSSAILTYLPTSGLSGPLTQDSIDPVTDDGGTFAGDVAALQLDLDFDAAHLMPGSVRFADVTLCSLSPLPALNGLSVPAFVSLLNTLLGGGTGPYTISQLEGITAQLANSFPAGVVSPFAHDHLVVGACPATPSVTPTTTPSITPTAEPFVCCKSVCATGLTNCERIPDCSGTCSNLCAGFSSRCVAATPSGCPDGQDPLSCAEGCQPICPPTFTPTGTPTSTPTNTPVPQGGTCATPAQCGTGFCVDSVCCDTACTTQRCAATSAARLGHVRVRRQRHRH
jgi:hypothetical protein